MDCEYEGYEDYDDYPEIGYQDSQRNQSEEISFNSRVPKNEDKFQGNSPFSF